MVVVPPAQVRGFSLLRNNEEKVENTKKCQVVNCLCNSIIQGISILRLFNGILPLPPLEKLERNLKLSISVTLDLKLHLWKVLVFK